MQMRLRFGAIFDMDGVLVDSAAAHLRAWSALGDKIGTPFTEEVFRSTFGMHNAQIIPIWLQRELPPVELDRMSSDKEEMFRTFAAESLKPLEGATEIVRSLAADGFDLAVGSSGPRANVELVLDILGVRESFTALATGDDVKNGKPHPEVFLKAAAGLGIDAKECVVLEDAPQGIEAGRAAGARVVALTSSRSASDLADADLIVDSLTELSPDRLRDLLPRRS